MVATVDGKPMTAGEVNDFLESLPPQMQQSAQRDKKELVKYYAMMSKLAKSAEEQKLDQQPMYKGRLEFARKNILMQSVIEQEMNKAQITDDQIKAHYEKAGVANGAAQTKVLYISFSNDGKGRTEAEAKTKIEELRKQAIGGADFVKIIQENSDDKMSKQNDGNYPPIKKGDGFPEAIKAAIFTLKPGEYTEPIRQASGFYVFKLEKMDTPSLDQAKDQVITQLRQQRFNEWFNQLRNSIDIKFDNEQYFAPATVAPPAAPPAAPKQ